jgi:hypothetical protein
MVYANSLEVIVTDEKKQGKYFTKFFYQGAEIYSEPIEINRTKSLRKYAKEAYVELKSRHPDAEIPQDDIFQAVCQAVEKFNRGEVLPKEKEEELTEEEKAAKKLAEQEAEELANDPRLLTRIVEDLKLMGITGQTEIALTAYLVGTSRLLDDPIHMLIQGTSSSGKSFIVNTVASLFPREEKCPFGHITPSALYHTSEEIQHKFVILNERPRQNDPKDTDRMKAYRELISEKFTCQYTTESTPDGRFISRYKYVEGPISSIGTVTHDDISTEDRTRFIIMAIYTDKKLRRFIRARKRVYKDDDHDVLKALRDRIRYKHIAFQSKLKRYTVHVSPIIDELIRMSLERLGLNDEELRIHERCLGIVESITLLYQQQRRKSKNGTTISATLKDYEMARPLIDAWLGGIILESGREISKQAMALFEKIRVHKDISRGLPVRVITKDCGGGYSERSIYDFLEELVKAGLLKKNRVRPNAPYFYTLEKLASGGEQTITLPATPKNLWLAMRNVKADKKENCEYETTESYVPAFEKYPHLYRLGADSQAGEKPTIQEFDKKVAHLRLTIKTRGENGKPQPIPTAKEWDEAGRTKPSE